MPPHEQAVDDRSNMVLSACDQLKSWIDDTHFNLAFQSGRTGLEAGNELHLVIRGLTRTNRWIVCTSKPCLIKEP